jgi:hypothetical protein
LADADVVVAAFGLIIPLMNLKANRPATTASMVSKNNFTLILAHLFRNKFVVDNKSNDYHNKSNGCTDKNLFDVHLSPLNSIFD